MSTERTLSTYYQGIVEKLSGEPLVRFKEEAAAVMQKHNDTKISLWEKLDLADFHFVPELKQRILSDLRDAERKSRGLAPKKVQAYSRYVITVDPDASLEELVKRGQYARYGTDHTSENYPKPNWEAKKLELLVIPFGKLSKNSYYPSLVKAVTEEFGSLGRFAGIYELAHLGWQHPHVQEKFIELYGMGSHAESWHGGYQMKLWKAPMLTYDHQSTNGPKVRGFYSKFQPLMMHDHNFCPTGFVMVKS